MTYVKPTSLGKPLEINTKPSEEAMKIAQAAQTKANENADAIGDIVNILNNVPSNAAVGTLTDLQTADKTSVVKAVNENFGKIDIMQKANVNIANYNPDPTGVNDSTPALILAADHSNSITSVSSLPVAILLPPGTYRINKTADLIIPSLICVGGTATLIIEDSFSFIISSNFNMSNINVVSKIEYSNTDSSNKPIFKATNTVENINFTNVIFDSQLSVTDGSKRASACIDLQIVNNCKLNNITVKGYRRFFTSTGTSSNVKGVNLHFENVELPIYMSGSNSNITDTNYAKNIEFTNVSHINTQTQAQNYFKLAGSDTFLFEKCDTITISNVTSEYAVERSIYCSSCNNLIASNFQIKNSEGIKFVGYVRNDVGLNNMANTCRLTNISLTVTTTADVWLASFYFAKNVTVKNCTMNGGNIATSAIYTLHYIENLTVENCYAENLKRGFFEFTYYGTIAAVGSIPANPDGNYPGGMNGFYALNNTVKNSHGGSVNYNVFKITDLSGITLPAGTFRHNDVVISRTMVMNSNGISNYGAILNATCQGLININDIQNLRILDNTVYGYYQKDGNNNMVILPFQTGANTKNVQIRHKEMVNNRDVKYYFGTIYASSSTEIEILNTSRFDAYEDRAVVTLKLDTADVTITKDLSQFFRIKGTTTVANTTDFTFPIIGYSTTGSTPAYNLPNIYGMVDVAGDNGDFGKYYIAKNGAVTLQSGATALFATAAASGKFALYKDGSLPRYTLRYQTGTTMSFVINYSLSSV